MNNQDFINHFHDTNKDTLKRIKLISLPKNGDLKFANKIVYIDQEIDE